MRVASKRSPQPIHIKIDIGRVAVKISHFDGKTKTNANYGEFPTVSRKQKFKSNIIIINMIIIKF
jgi:hypothetical protein